MNLLPNIIKNFLLFQDELYTITVRSHQNLMRQHSNPHLSSHINSNNNKNNSNSNNLNVINNNNKNNQESQQQQKLWNYSSPVLVNHSSTPIKGDLEHFPDQQQEISNLQKSNISSTSLPFIPRGPAPPKPPRTSASLKKCAAVVNKLATTTENSNPTTHNNANASR